MSANRIAPFTEIGGFQILEWLESRGGPDIYLARADQGGGADKLVALHLVAAADASSLERLREGARQSAALKHRNVLPVLGIVEADTRAFIATEYLAGWDLLRLINELIGLGRPAPVALVTGLAFEVARAVSHVHESGCVHGDVTPSNVFLGLRGEVKLQCFLAASSRVVTPGAFTAPELQSGGAPTISGDVYSAGALLHALLTSQLPNEAEILGARLAPSLANPAVPPQLEEIVVRATARDPAARYSTSAALKSALEGVLPTLSEDGDEAMACVAQLAREGAGRRQRIKQLTVEGRRVHAQRTSRPPAPPPPAAPAPPPPAAPESAPRPASPVDTAPPIAAGVAAGQPRGEMDRPAFAAAPPARRRNAWTRPFVGGLAACALVAAGVFGFTAWQGSVTDAAVNDHLAIADVRTQGGALIGPGEDHALGHLLAATRLAPDSEQVRQRRVLLADTFVVLGEAAARRADLGEASVHFEAALKADPSRESIRKRLQQIEVDARRAAVQSRSTPP